MISKFEEESVDRAPQNTNGYLRSTDSTSSTNSNLESGRVSLYIHWPFCKSKCPYCDFNSHVASKINHESWLNAYLTELDYFADYLRNKAITSIFFGGGTPSLMETFIVDKILNHLNKNYQLANNVEITLEANPTSFEASKFKDFNKAGINRISLGIQSLNDRDLKFLGREHSAAEAIKVIKQTAEIFDNFSFDLIYARPEQSLNEWKEELTTAIDFGTKHLSLYQLTIEKGTRFYSDYQKGLFQMPNDIHKADLYKITEDLTLEKGMLAYEVSNYAYPMYESKHNLSYWRYDEYLGIGPGAHSRIVLDNQRTAMMMLHKPESWLEEVSSKGAAIQQQNILDSNEILTESLMMRLRIFEPIYFEWLEEIGINTAIINKSKLLELSKNKMLELNDKYFRITKEGRLVLNSIIDYLL